MDLDYIQALEREMIDNGVTVPLSFNDVSIASWETITQSDDRSLMNRLVWRLDWSKDPAMSICTGSILTLRALMLRPVGFRRNGDQWMRGIMRISSPLRVRSEYRFISWVFRDVRDEVLQGKSAEMLERRDQPEFQGGTINQWTQPVVDDCQPLFGAEFERVFYLHNLASGVKMHNVYMVYGGEWWLPLGNANTKLTLFHGRN
jgi:hypothetical protein